jgi:ABC-type nitrate/sulfonate/bicarbonate transport system ATPase subunit
MAQRVAFARAVVQQSEVILLDEPFSALDFYTKRKLQDWFKNKIKEANKYALFVTHDIHEALFLSQQIVVLEGDPCSVQDIFKNVGGVFLNNSGTAFDLNYFL